jgi:superfamily II DNA or RNA helicase
MVDQTGYYQSPEREIRLFARPGDPRWRSPQMGALGALSAHWSVPTVEPALITLPTGSGKTAIALAAPYLCASRRVLVVVPSRALRTQIASNFRDQGVLRSIGAITHEEEPSVRELSGLVKNWEDLEAADVVVSLPNSVSPAHYPDNPPPAGLFDLIVVDEAHHAPALTWRAILEHFQTAKSILLTATPYRRDGQRLPGTPTYHYPLRRALEEGIYKSVRAMILTPTSATDRRMLDEQIAVEVMGLLRHPEHATSAALVRTSSRERAKELAALYARLGQPVEVLHSGLSERHQKGIIEGLTSGQHRVVAVIGMLGEGFDLPRLRVVGYHDKHKSLPATAQLIGRLARADNTYPQPSVVVAVRDVDVYPELEGAVRALYDEDADWAKVLPGIIDDQVAEDLVNRAYASTFTPAPPALAVEAIQPIRRAVVWEFKPESRPPQDFMIGSVPDEFGVGRLIRGATIFYSNLDRAGKTLLLVASSVEGPKWLNDSGLDGIEYELILVSYRGSPRTGLPDLVFVNADDDRIAREVRRILGIDEDMRRADPTRLNEAFDSLRRVSVSSIGVRTTLTGRGTPSYRMFAGSGVDRGLRDGDTAFGALGHAIVQATDQDGTFSAGVATGKAKYWEMRYSPLRQYSEFVSSLAERYWFPSTSAVGQLLPQVTRGRRLATWPNAEPLTAELDYGLIGTQWHTDDGVSLDTLELRAAKATADTVSLELLAPTTSGFSSIWRGTQDLAGNVVPSGKDTLVRHGLGSAWSLGELLTDRPPTIFFADGTTIRGQLEYDSRNRGLALPANLVRGIEWPTVDITAETSTSLARHAAKAPRRRKPASSTAQPTASPAGAPLRSVHEALEDHLKGLPKLAKRRWIICNDGSGEFADYVVVEKGRRSAHISLWHAKYAHGAAPSVRVLDLQEVIAQAIKSRRWITEVGFWSELGARLNHRSAPFARIVDGDPEELLQILCGERPRWQRYSAPVTRPHVTGHVRVVQPGLSVGELRQRLDGGHSSAAERQSALQCRELLVALHDTVTQVASVEVLASA